ncbi:MAG: response regulator transcription factor [Marmoricola sp.]
MATIAVCEDDAPLRSVLRRALESAGHQVLLATDAGELLRQVTRGAHLYVLDIGLPDADGRDLLRALRAHGVGAPVLLLTALDGTHDLVAGFESGADDYLTKPFDLPELLVRVQALLRRTRTEVDAGGLVLDPTGHRAVAGERSTTLSPTEFRLLARLLAAPGEAVRRHALVAAAWPHGAQVSENTLDSYVRRIRSKLADLDQHDRIATVRGVGYRWQ